MKERTIGGSVPAELPSILKEFTKAAIRTQPYDLLQWAHAYFKCMAEGEMPPVKEWLEQRPQVEGSVTPGLLRVLHKQLNEPCSPTSTIALKQFEAKWMDVCLKPKDLNDILASMSNENNKEVIWPIFVAEAINKMGLEDFRSLLSAAMIVFDSEQGVSSEILGVVIKRLAMKRDVSEEIAKDLVDCIQAFGCQNDNLVRREDLDKEVIIEKMAQFEI